MFLANYLKKKYKRSLYIAFLRDANNSFPLSSLRNEYDKINRGHNVN